MNAARMKHFGWGREGEGMSAEERAFVLGRYHEKFARDAFATVAVPPLEDQFVIGLLDEDPEEPTLEFEAGMDPERPVGPRVELRDIVELTVDDVQQERLPTGSIVVRSWPVRWLFGHDRSSQSRSRSSPDRGRRAMTVTKNIITA